MPFFRSKLLATPGWRTSSSYWFSLRYIQDILISGGFSFRVTLQPSKSAAPSAVVALAVEITSRFPPCPHFLPRAHKTRQSAIAKVNANTSPS
jgi:hypothetical protein